MLQLFVQLTGSWDLQGIWVPAIIILWFSGKIEIESLAVRKGSKT